MTRLQAMVDKLANIDDPAVREVPAKKRSELSEMKKLRLASTNPSE